MALSLLFNDPEHFQNNMSSKLSFNLGFFSCQIRTRDVMVEASVNSKHDSFMRFKAPLKYWQHDSQTKFEEEKNYALYDAFICF